MLHPGLTAQGRGDQLPPVSPLLLRLPLRLPVYRLLPVG